MVSEPIWEYIKSDPYQVPHYFGKWFWVLLCSVNLFTYNLDSFKSRKWLNSSIWLIDETLTGTATPGQGGPESNGNEGAFHIFQTSE